MLSAEEARKRTVEVLNRRVTFEEAEEAISKAIALGNFECKFEKRSLAEGVKELLQKEGFLVEADDRVRVVRIRWIPLPPPYYFD